MDSPPPPPTSSLAAEDDTSLLRRHCDGDADAFGELFRRHQDRMWAVAIRTLGDREAAADCVQEAFISAFRRAASFRGDAAVTTWLHRIVVNACIDRMRRERALTGRTTDVAEVERADPHDHQAGAETALIVRAALAQLPEQQRLALVLVDMHGYSVAEAAAILEVAEGTVKSRCFRGRVALAEILRPGGGEVGVDTPAGTNLDPRSSDRRPDTSPSEPQHPTRSTT
ncbi:MAG: RNA polymerase sigma factor SigM [Phycicoccus sp.]|nr:RNA polymerase sigma factor SigM [Phycicoccus sp.]